MHLEGRDFDKHIRNTRKYEVFCVVRTTRGICSMSVEFWWKSASNKKLPHYQFQRVWSHQGVYSQSVSTLWLCWIVDGWNYLIWHMLSETRSSSTLTDVVVMLSATVTVRALVRSARPTAGCSAGSSVGCVLQSAAVWQTPCSAQGPGWPPPPRRPPSSPPVTPATLSQAPSVTA